MIINRTQTDLHLKNLLEEIENSSIEGKFNHIQVYYLSDGQEKAAGYLELDVDDTWGDAENAVLDTILSNHDNVDDDLIINDLVEKSVKGKNVTSINYKTELKDGISLHPVEIIDNDGLLNTVEYYNNYVDANDKGDKVLEVVHTWNIDPTEPITSAKKVIDRTKTWSYKNHAGVEKKKKVKSKKYDTAKKVTKEGMRRRDNILSQSQVGTVTILLLTGTFGTQSLAEQALIDIFELYASEFKTWQRTGKGHIYDVLNEDGSTTTPDNTWLDVTIGATAQSVLGLPSGWDVKDIREYIIEKLKGNV